MKAILWLFLLLGSFSFGRVSAAATGNFVIGFNQGWIFNRYGGQWVDGFDLNEFKRVFQLTKNANGNIVRLWLFEGHSSQALVWDGNRFTGLNPRFITNLKLVLGAAKEMGLQLNLTLLDGNMGGNDPQPIQLKNYWWNLLNNKYGVRQDFITNVFYPLLGELAAPEFAGVVTQLDIANEINALTLRRRPLRFEAAWNEANRFVCEFYNAKNQVWPAGRFTASVGWGDSQENVLGGHPWPDCVDFFSFHLYNDGGEITRCRELANYAHSRGKAIYLGEFGQSWPWSADSLQSASTRNFIRNARACGLDGAMAWRLAEPESSAHLTFERNGVLRPAYWTFQREAAY